MNDDELREMFQAQRRDDARRAPGFRAMWKKRQPRSAWRLVGAIASVAAAAAVLVVWCRSPEEPQVGRKLGSITEQPRLIAVQWDPAPLDFLLETPGIAALAGTPDFGTGR
jgi:hypothetical protein